MNKYKENKRKLKFKKPRVYKYSVGQRKVMQNENTV